MDTDRTRVFDFAKLIEFVCLQIRLSPTVCLIHFLFEGGIEFSFKLVIGFALLPGVIF